MPDLNIPHEVLQKYLPSQNLTISDVISFNLPCMATKLTDRQLQVQMI
jgi:hypothetical protein